MNINKLIPLCLLFFFIPIASSHDLEGAIKSDERTPKNVARDAERHPYQTLSFFELRPDMTVVSFLRAEVGTQRYLQTIFIILASL